MKHAGFDLPLELFEPEIEFPLSIFTLKECVSNSLRERDLSTAALRDTSCFVLCGRAKRDLKLSEPWVLVLGICLWV